MSFNILWEESEARQMRKNRVASMIRIHRADLIGLQEPSRSQILKTLFLGKGQLKNI